jgi:hypothetical protein
MAQFQEVLKIVMDLSPNSSAPLNMFPPKHFTSLLQPIRDKATQLMKEFSPDQMKELRLEVGKAYYELATQLCAERSKVYREMPFEIEAWNVGRRVLPLEKREAPKRTLAKFHAMPEQAERAAEATHRIQHCDELLPNSIPSSRRLGDAAAHSRVERNCFLV